MQKILERNQAKMRPATRVKDLSAKYPWRQSSWKMPENHKELIYTAQSYAYNSAIIQQILKRETNIGIELAKAAASYEETDYACGI